ncbi:MAG: hypothetical protein ACKO04_10570 [Actinomycetes bacterium]
MTIRRGEDWGASGPLASGAPVCADDATAASALAAQLAAGTDPPEVGLTGGDLHRTLGGPRRGATELRTGMGVRYPVDLLELECTDPDGSVRSMFALSSVVVGSGRRLWDGRWTVLMNGTCWQDWDLGPRAHPNDGLVDVTDGTLPRRVRKEARRRSVTGTHVPHPDLRQERVAVHVVEGLAGRRLLVDGVRVPTPARLVVRVCPDAAVVVA